MNILEKIAVRILDNTSSKYQYMRKDEYEKLVYDNKTQINIINDNHKIHENYKQNYIRLQNEYIILEQKNTEMLDRVKQIEDLQELDSIHKDGILAQMIDMQKELYNLNGMPSIDFDRPIGLRAGKMITEGIAQFVTSAIHEAVELQNWTDWKPWSRQLGNKSSIERWSNEHIKEMRMEVIDLFAFVLNLCCLLGIDWRMLWLMYREKMDINVNIRHNSGTY